MNRYTLCCIQLYFVSLVVEYYEISVADVESRQVVARVFRVKNVFVNNKSCAPGLDGISPENTAYKVEEKKTIIQIITPVIYVFNIHSNLSDSAVFAKDVVHFFSCDFVRQIFDVQNPVNFRG